MLYRLKTAGFEAFLVGGGVRDMLLGREPKDFDIATNASPEQVKEQFRNCRLIGRRFRLAHVHFGRDVIEVATFRAPHDTVVSDDDDREIVDGTIIRDNVFGTLEDDAWRRDFTVNALYYDIRDFSVVDYTGGIEDLKAGVLRLIGDPVQRYQEDPVRMLRAVRFAAKLGFVVHPDAEAPLFTLATQLNKVPPARLFEEVLKLFLGGVALKTFELLRHYGLFGQLFGQTEKALELEEHNFPLMFIARVLTNTDARLSAGKPVTPAFLFAGLLWEPVRLLAKRYEAEGMSDVQALQTAAEVVTNRQVQSIALPKRFSLPMREIWMMQPRLQRVGGVRSLRLLSHPRFRAAYDFLLLREEAGEVPSEAGAWWTALQAMNEEERGIAVKPTSGQPRKKGRRRTRSANRPSSE